MDGLYLMLNSYTKFFKGTILKIAFEADVAEYLRVHGPSVSGARERLTDNMMSLTGPVFLPSTSMILLGIEALTRTNSVSNSVSLY
jgi:hypothetical protein